MENKKLLKMKEKMAEKKKEKYQSMKEMKPGLMGTVAGKLVGEKALETNHKK